MLEVSLLSAIGFLIILIKTLSLEGVLKHEIKIDVAVTLGFLWFSGGTYSGIVTAIMTGIIMSISLLLIRWIYHA